MYAPYVILDYLKWHYSRAFRDSIAVWFNFLWFAVYFFSLPTLFLTLFSPWKRIQEVYQRGEGLETFAADVVVNILSRIVGALVRLVVIAMGLSVLVTLLICFGLFMVFWIVAPVALVWTLLVGLQLLF